MKVKIIKKSIKEGDNYCIKSLFCSVDNKEDANKLALAAIAAGATKEQVGTLIKAGEYNGNVTYAFGLNCSNFTFEKVDRLGILDAEIIYIKNEKGYINAKIQVIDRKEQINGYEAPEEEVVGWATEAPPIKAQEQTPFFDKADTNPISDPFAASLDPNVKNDLPFN